MRVRSASIAIGLVGAAILLLIGMAGDALLLADAGVGDISSLLHRTMIVDD